MLPLFLLSKGRLINSVDARNSYPYFAADDTGGKRDEGGTGWTTSTYLPLPFFPLTRL